MNNMLNINNNMMNMYNMLNMNNLNKNKITDNFYNKNNEIKVCFRFKFRFSDEESRIIIFSTLDEKLQNLIQKFRAKAGNYDTSLRFIFNAKALNLELTCAEAGISDKSNIFVIETKDVKGAGGWLMKEINIKFIKNPQKNNNFKNNNNDELLGLLKLCLLKDISLKLDENQLKTLSEMTFYIMRLLKNGYIESPDMKKNIRDILEKMRGINIINFSRFADEIINANELKNIMNLLGKNDFIEIKNTKNRLSSYNKYIKLFDTEFEKAKKESIFEFSIISLVVMEREDFEIFERERNKCPNRVEKILYHGTSIEPISCILTGYFRKSTERCYQHGKGVYFTDFLDYCWFYGGEGSNRANKNRIPKKGETFTLIACSIYYDQNGFRKVKDYKYTPKKNEINFAYADCQFETLETIDNTKFVGTEYVIWELDQICPFLGAKLKRNEFCVIWRDNNFSSKPIYNNEFDERFKNFLKERIKYIQQMANFNIYTFDNSEEALNLIKRKKYNKIILISNVGSDYGGRTFVTNARKIIGNDVIALFLAYKESHLEWITQYKNALFSNSSKFYEDYLECFNSNEYCIKENILEHKEKLEKYYDVKFNFDDQFLYFPLYKESGKYSDLTF
jgi:hypothetical protein